MWDIWITTSVVLFALCGLGVGLCREVMLEEVQRRLPDGKKISYPYVSWKYLEIVRLHERFYPESRIRAVGRCLKYVALASIGTIGLAAFGTVILKSIPR